MTIHRFNILIASALCLATTACGDDDSNDPAQPSRPDANPVSVIDYSPAPGQFINKLPLYTAGATSVTMAKAAERMIASGDPVSLGALGGSITLRLNQPITNTHGANDFAVLGNAITTGAEPGIIYVMTDANNNGEPDDGEWLMIKPEGYNKAKILTVTYYAPTPSSPEDKHIAWTASDGSAGFIPRLPLYHTQNYFPEWISAASIKFTALALQDNSEYDPATGTWTLNPVHGTADCYPNDSQNAGVSLDGAIDSNGNYVDVKQISFVKIVTGILKCNGNIGECSTEVSGIKRLHN